MAPACLVLGLLAFLILKQPNLGSTVALLVTGVTLLYLAGTRLRHLLLLGAAGATAAWVAVLRNAYMMDRVEAWRAQWGSGVADTLGVITSYSIHYTKLYDSKPGPRTIVRFSRS